MKNYLIIGGSTGIGRALATTLSAENQVFATFSKHECASEGNIQYYNLNVLEDILDLSFLPERLDGLVYCPGAIQLKPFGRTKPNDFLADYQLQVLGAVKVLQQVLPKLKNAEHPAVVFFSTVAVQTGFNFHSIVSASKGAIEGLTKALAAEYAPKIRINCIAPSITDTPLAGTILNTPEKKEANAQRHPLKKVGEADDIAHLAEFLLSDKASWITGQIFHIDGGISSLKM
jgi:NAD(P)-dependent dehydrogenase (short-subunit alcohol dehydrogenase family)